MNFITLASFIEPGCAIVVEFADALFGVSRI
jgi:hypothetical protein